MTSPGFRKPTTPYDALAQQIAELAASVRDLQRPHPVQIPVLSADPPLTDPTNIWLFPDGRMRARHLNSAGSWVTREWVPTTAGSATTASAAVTPGTAATTKQTEWPATYTQSYRQSGAARTDNGAIDLYYGSSGDSFNGLNRSLIGFDHANIASTLSGAEIIAVWIKMTNKHSYNNSGSDVHLGVHNFSSEPATWGGGGIPRSMVQRFHWGKGEQNKVVIIPLVFAQAIRDGWGKGVALESPTTSRTYYGYMAGIGSGYPPPVLIVQYAK